MQISWDSAPCIFVSFSFPSLERVVLYTGSAYAQNKLITAAITEGYWVLDTICLSVTYLIVSFYNLSYLLFFLSQQLIRVEYRNSYWELLSFCVTIFCSENNISQCLAQQKHWNLHFRGRGRECILSYANNT